MVAGMVSLALQLLLTGRVLRRLGIGMTLFIVPVALAFTSVGVLATGTLLAATLLRASDQVLRYSIDKATVELLYLPVPAAQTFVREVVHRHRGLSHGRWAGWRHRPGLRDRARLEPRGHGVGVPAAAGRLDGGGRGGAPRIRREPAGQHPPASAGRGARLRRRCWSAWRRKCSRRVCRGPPAKSSTRSACSRWPTTAWCTRRCGDC